jgi:uncharacterized protein YeaO (DUF488 family)
LIGQFNVFRIAVDGNRRRADTVLAALSRVTNLSLGCYCKDESRCHRSVLRELLAERGADVI